MNSAHAVAYALALRAASEATAGQNYPPGALYVVATPIGNLADITLRALHLLQIADSVACEDTRHSQTLLRAYGIDKTAAQLLAVHQHNESEAAQIVIERLRQGQRVAYASDAGTPAISDPGARLVAAVRLAGLPVIPLPGASSVTTALSVAGIAPEGVQEGSFVFIGFLPNKSGERTTAVEALRLEARSVVLLEAPHRIEALATALAVLGQRTITVGRELTKQFEEITNVSAEGLPAWLAEDANRLRGEFVLVLHPRPGDTSGEPDDRVLKLLLAELPLKTAVKLSAEITGQPRNVLYELALRLKKD
ncbi:MAG: 16S rRNA (cytidine(1402)-2'-O)-methyltransferase [Burkholderiales bacterium]|nr:16S rRNA (cytidine(1402)-2'-O)-methyltransferase [Burkholderiales bacterium]